MDLEEPTCISKIGKTLILNKNDNGRLTNLNIGSDRCGTTFNFRTEKLKKAS